MHDSLVPLFPSELTNVGTKLEEKKRKDFEEEEENFFLPSSLVSKICTFFSFRQNTSDIIGKIGYKFKSFQIKSFLNGSLDFSHFRPWKHLNTLINI